jgi:hypothetical protein
MAPPGIDGVVQVQILGFHNVFSALPLVTEVFFHQPPGFVFRVSKMYQKTLVRAFEYSISRLF